MPFPLALSTVGAIALSLASSTGAPESSNDRSYTATIDCGAGAVEVVSSDSLFAPLVHRPTGRRYHPVAWDVEADGERIVARRKGARKSRRVVRCSYDDTVAAGTVTVRRP